MSELRLTRNFPVAPDKVFAFVTETAHLAKWWGPEAMNVPDADMDFTRPGAWVSVMVNAEGGRHKVSGEVLEVDPPNKVEFTWAWHDENDQRGHESRVRFEVAPDGRGGADFVLIHSGLQDDESAANHKMGWTSSLKKLERLAG
jgi:uncharacterized protein YndB with AHSA1/START domain